MSLCSGIGGLELGLERAGLGTVIAQSEIDPHASEVLARHWPGVPNLGDFRGVDLPECEVLCAGFPCQPVSSAGRRKGTEDERWLFDDIAAAVGRMDPRPRLLVFENVRGLLSANGGDAMARVVHGLAALGYVGRYGLLSAAGVGSCHLRRRVFIAAWNTDLTPEDARPAGRGSRGGAGEPDRPAPDASHVGLDGSRRARDGRTGPADRGDAAADTDDGGRRGRASCGEPSLGWGHGLPSERRQGQRELARGAGPDWGPYAPAIERWERLTRPAPDPTIGGRLSPRFVEWMMGFPEGWVDGLTRTAALRCLGNAVVPQVAEAFGRMILGNGGGCAVPPEATLLPTPNTLDGMSPRSDEALARAKLSGGCSNLKDVIPRLTA